SQEFYVVAHPLAGHQILQQGAFLALPNDRIEHPRDRFANPVQGQNHPVVSLASLQPADCQDDPTTPPTKPLSDLLASGRRHEVAGVYTRIQESDTFGW